MTNRGQVINPAQVWDMSSAWSTVSVSVCSECFPTGEFMGRELSPLGRSEWPAECDLCEGRLLPSGDVVVDYLAQLPGSVFVAIGRGIPGYSLGDGWGVAPWSDFQSAVCAVLAHYSFDSSGARNDEGGVNRVSHFHSVAPVGDSLGGVEDSALFVVYDSITDTGLRPALARLAEYWLQDSVALTTSAGVEFILGDSLSFYEADETFYDLVERWAQR